jgi:hypothetical protein
MATNREIMALGETLLEGSQYWLQVSRWGNVGEYVRVDSVNDGVATCYTVNNNPVSSGLLVNIPIGSVVWYFTLVG